MYRNVQLIFYSFDVSVLDTVVTRHLFVTSPYSSDGPMSHTRVTNNFVLYVGKGDQVSIPWHPKCANFKRLLVADRSKFKDFSLGTYRVTHIKRYDRFSRKPANRLCFFFFFKLNDSVRADPRPM